MQNTFMTYPVSVNDDGVKIKPELMEPERLYHCFFKDKLMLFFKDPRDFLNCYEIEEEELIKRAREASGDDLQAILEDYTRNLH